MTIFQIDEFVICEYATWDGDFTPPTSEWSPNARQLSPTNGLIELPLYIRPGIGDGSNGRGSGIVIASPGNANFTLRVFSRVTLGVVIFSPEDAVLLLPIQLQRNLDIVIPSPENTILQLQSSSFPSLDIVIPSPENAVLQLQIFTQTNLDVVVPSSENAILSLHITTQTNLDISIPSIEDAEFILLAITECGIDIIIPSPEDVILTLSFIPSPIFSIVNYNIRYDELLRDRIYCTSVNPRIGFNIEVLALLLLEDFLNKYFVDITEVLTLSDISKPRLGLILREYLTIQDSQRVHWDGTRTLIDTFFMYENLKIHFIKTINEALSLTDSPSAMLGLLLSEFIAFTETTLPNWNTTRTVNESIALTDSVVQALQLFITESLTLTDVQVVQLQLFLAEFVSLSESVIPNWNSTRIVNESIALTDSLVQSLQLLITESLTLTAAQTVQLQLVVSEFMSLIGNATANWNTTRTLTDTFGIKDFLYQRLVMILTESLVITDSVPLSQLGLAIYEYLGFTELLSSPGRFTSGIADTLVTTDSLSFGYAQAISDVFSLVDTADVVRLLLNNISESLGLSESLAGLLGSTLPVIESLVLADTVASQGRLYSTLYDTLFLGVTVEINGEIWECYVLNTPKFLPSVYTGFNFNSYAVFQNRAYGCKADGIYELTGDTDNGVAFHTGVQLSETKFGLPNQKRFRKAYIGVSGTTPLLTMETEAGESLTYSIDADGEVDASRALRSKKWKLTLTDFDTLDFIKLVPVVLAK